MTTNYYILIAGWIMFSALHSVTATEQCKRFFRSKMNDSFRYYRLMYSMVSAIMVGSLLAWQLTIPTRYVASFPILKYVLGLPGAICGIVLMLTCIRIYFYKLSGVREVLQRSCPPVLESGGVHRIVRHPLYLGTLLSMWATFLFFPTLANLLSFGVINCYTIIGIYYEEKKLIRIFGRSYIEYQQSTPMLIPNPPGLGRIWVPKTERK